MKVRIIELFGGIGACTTALKRLGFDVDVVDYVEINSEAVKSYNVMNDESFYPQDITSWHKHFEDIDLIMHGSPCQDFSGLGKGEGGDENSGTRSSLLYETLRIVDDIKPKYVVWENVKNLVSQKHIHNFQKYLDKMSHMGYTNYFQILNSKDYGIPQNRERIFTISIRNDLEKHFEFPNPVVSSQRLSDFMETKPNSKYVMSNEYLDRISIWKSFQNPLDKVHGRRSFCPTLTARGAGEYHSGMVLYSPHILYDTNLGNCYRSYEIRRMTPREAWRLQGFDDALYDKAASVSNERELYRQAGNSITVNVLYYLFRELIHER